MKKPENRIADAERRRRAEELKGQAPSVADSLSTAEIRRHNRELQLQQIELELQVEELRLKQIELELQVDGLQIKQAESDKMAVTELNAVQGTLRKSEQLAALGRMAAQMAHEINNPLAGISNSFQLVKDSIPESHAYYAYVGRIEKEIGRVTRIVHQMLDLCPPQGELVTEFLLDEVLSDVVSILELDARSHGVRISIDPATEKLRIFLQENWLRQILFNLVQNAVEASRVSSGEVRIRTLVQNETVSVIIEDNGGGIAPEVLPRLFEPFFTTKHDARRPGVGLGLSVSKNLAAAMGGTIEVETKPGVGSRFHLILPRAMTSRQSNN